MKIRSFFTTKKRNYTIFSQEKLSVLVHTKRQVKD